MFMFNLLMFNQRLFSFLSSQVRYVQMERLNNIENVFFTFYALVKLYVVIGLILNNKEM